MLVLRAARFILEKEVDPKTILILTFSRKAMLEARHRMKKLIGPKRNMQPTISTFHGFSLKLLNENAYLAGIEPGIKTIEESKW